MGYQNCHCEHGCGKVNGEIVIYSSTSGRVIDKSKVTATYLCGGGGRGCGGVCVWGCGGVWARVCVCVCVILTSPENLEISLNPIGRRPTNNSTC